MKFLPSIILLLLLSQTSKAQNKLPSMDYVPQTPIASAFSRYGEIPVDHSTGVPRIEIPIYTLKVGDVSLPITISYHASGIKIRDVASEVGLGFVLNTGGVVTANIIGKSDLTNDRAPDFKTANDIYFAIGNARNSHTTFDLAWLYKNRYIEGSLFDLFSDRFSYSLCTGESGIFRKDYVNGSLKFLPYRPIDVKIRQSFYIDITASNGYKHFFSTVSSERDFFKLDKIVSEDRVDSVLYYYSNRTTETLNIQYMMDWRFEQLTPHPQETCFFLFRNALDGYQYSDLMKSGGVSITFVPLLDSIVSKNEVITFEYIRDRVDKNNHGYRLLKINVKDKFSRQTIKSIVLDHSYFGTTGENNLRLRLDGVQIAGSTNEAIEKYSFAYNNMPLPPYPTFLEENYWEDYWGYYNGAWKNNLLPSFFSNFGIPSGYNYADMNPNGVYTQACILTRIKFPSGGSTFFEYESNTLPNVFPPTLRGGLRIKKITSYTDETSKALIKTYAYSEPVYKAIEPTSFKYLEDHWIGNSEPGRCNISLADYHKNIGTQNSLRPISLSNGTSIIYKHVTEFFGDEDSNIGKKVYRYSYEDGELRNERPGSIDEKFFSFYHSDAGNYVPQLDSVKTYKSEDGIYVLARTHVNNYAKHKESEFNTGVNFASAIVIGHENFSGISPDATFEEYHNRYDYLQSLVYTDTKAYEEISLLTESITIDHINSNTSVQTVETYGYEPDYAQLRHKTITTSDNKTLKTEYKYPKDFGSIEPYQSMISRNILTPVIEQSEFKGTSAAQSDFLESVKTNYNAVSPNIIVPVTVQTKHANEPYETRINYHAYDNKGNVLSVSKKDDITTSYIWGYNYTHPVAKIVGAEYATAYNLLTQAEKDALINPANDAQVRTIIQKIRSHDSMANALVHTYTYKPLVGVTSVTDENGLINYFEYDSFNRLQLMKDSDGNILKSYTYHNRKH